MRPTAAEIEKWAQWHTKHRRDTDRSTTPLDLAAASGDAVQRRRSPAGAWGMAAVAVAVVIAGILGITRGLPALAKNQASANGTPAATTVLRLHGSNTIGAELTPALVESFLKRKGATRVVRIPGGPDEMVIWCSLPGKSQPSAVEIFAHGSSTAFEDLGSSQADIGLSSRRIKDEECATLKPLGEMTSPACEHVLALDGISIIVNQQNPVAHLTKAQVAKIFAGTITNWHDVGGRDSAIAIYARDDKSGTFDTFKNLVLGKETALAKTAERFENSEQLRQIVANDADGIGFVGMAYTKGVKSLAIADGSRPIAPSTFAVAAEDYPLSRRLFLYTPAQPTNALTSEFVEFALSDAGQNIATDIGFVGQNLQIAAHPSQTAQRLNFNFRFYSGSADLDTKGLRDQDRLATLLQDRQYRTRQILLYGYSDNRGDETANRVLSLERAQAVARLLKKRQLTPALVEGNGAANPVASNDTPEGRDRNRRVEVWIK